MALSSAPLFVAKLLAGGMSGALLQSLCPAEPCEGGRLLWLIIGLVTASSPVLIFLCARCIEGPARTGADEDGTELRGADSAAAAAVAPACTCSSTLGSLGGGANGFSTSATSRRASKPLAADDERARNDWAES